MMSEAFFYFDGLKRISTFQTKISLEIVPLLLTFAERHNILSAFFTGKTSTSDIFATFHSMKSVEPNSWGNDKLNKIIISLHHLEREKVEN